VVLCAGKFGAPFEELRVLNLRTVELNALKDALGHLAERTALLERRPERSRSLIIHLVVKPDGILSHI